MKAVFLLYVFPQNLLYTFMLEDAVDKELSRLALLQFCIHEQHENVDRVMKTVLLCSNEFLSLVATVNKDGCG